MNLRWDTVPALSKKPAIWFLGQHFLLRRETWKKSRHSRENSVRSVPKQPLDFQVQEARSSVRKDTLPVKLIMDSGLRGCQIGGARVSDKHCGFVINTGDATAEDVVSLMRHVTEVVREKYGVTLEPEVKFLGNLIRNATGNCYRIVRSGQIHSNENAGRCTVFLCR